MIKEIVKYIEEGKCPMCGSSHIQYGPAREQKDEVVYRCICNQCGSSFEELYKLEFKDQFVGSNFTISAKENAGIRLDIM